MREPDPVVLERELLLFQQRLRLCFVLSSATKNGAESAQLGDLKHKKKQLQRLSEGCRRIRAELFEACCEFQRNCSYATLQRLALLIANLKFLERIAA